MDLAQLLDELKERRWRAAHWTSAYHDERLAELAMLQGAIAALEAVLEEGRSAPQVDPARVLLF